MALQVFVEGAHPVFHISPINLSLDRFASSFAMNIVSIAVCLVLGLNILLQLAMIWLG